MPQPFANFRSFFALAIAVLFFSPGLFGQSTDSITIYRGGGTTYFQKDKKLNAKQLSAIVKGNPLAAKEMKMAKSRHAGATIFGAIAGGLLVDMGVRKSQAEIHRWHYSLLAERQWGSIAFNLLS